MYSSPSKKPKLEDVETNKEIDQQNEANKSPPGDDLDIDWGDEEIFRRMTREEFFRRMASEDCFRGMISEEIEECCEGMTTEDILEYRRYSLQVEESDGYDCDFVPKVFPNFLHSFIFPCDKKEPKEWEMVKNCVDYVITQYNLLMKGKSELKLERIDTANRIKSHYCTLYITFDAKEIPGERHTFQAEVCRRCEFDGSPSLDYPPYLLSIRKKGQKEGFCFPLDLNDQVEYDRMEEFARHAVSRYNKKGKSVLEYVRVVKAVRDMNMRFSWYCITFEAKDTILDQVNSYFVQVVYDVCAEEIRIYRGVNIATES